MIGPSGSLVLPLATTARAKSNTPTAPHARDSEHTGSEVALHAGSLRVTAAALNAVGTNAAAAGSSKGRRSVASRMPS